jgi:hypothetical protein
LPLLVLFIGVGPFSSIQLLLVCSGLMILFTIIYDLESLHIKDSSFSDQIHHRFTAPKQSYALGSVSGYGSEDPV